MDLYGEFVTKAAEGRNMKSEDLEALAQGRVYSGHASHRLGLTDSLGGYLEALETGRNLAEIPPSKKVRVREYPRPKLFETMAAKVFSLAILAKYPAAAAFSPIQARKASRFLEVLNYRFSHNGQIMPLLPLEFE
jgi:protease-4